MSKRERPFYPGPDDELDGKTDDEEANSDHESDPIQSSDDSNYESETDVTDSEKSDSESDQSDKQNVTAGDTEPLARYSRRRPLKIETKGFQSASREQIPPTQQDELQEAKRRRDRAHLPYFVYGPTFNPPTLAGQPRVTAGERTVPTADPAASSKQVPAPVTPAKEVPAPVAAANVVPAPVTPSNVVAAPLNPFKLRAFVPKPFAGMSFIHVPKSTRLFLMDIEQYVPPKQSRFFGDVQVSLESEYSVVVRDQVNNDPLFKVLFTFVGMNRGKIQDIMTGVYDDPEKAARRVDDKQLWVDLMKGCMNQDREHVLYIIHKMADMLKEELTLHLNDFSIHVILNGMMQYVVHDPVITVLNMFGDILGAHRRERIFADMMQIKTDDSILAARLNCARRIVQLFPQTKCLGVASIALASVPRMERANLNLKVDHLFWALQTLLKVSLQRGLLSGLVKLPETAQDLMPKEMAKLIRKALRKSRPFVFEAVCLYTGRSEKQIEMELERSAHFVINRLYSETCANPGNIFKFFKTITKVPERLIDPNYSSSTDTTDYDTDDSQKFTGPWKINEICNKEIAQDRTFELGMAENGQVGANEPKAQKGNMTPQQHQMNKQKQKQKTQGPAGKQSKGSAAKNPNKKNRDKNKKKAKEVERYKKEKSRKMNAARDESMGDGPSTARPASRSRKQHNPPPDPTLTDHEDDEQEKKKREEEKKKRDEEWERLRAKERDLIRREDAAGRLEGQLYQGLLDLDDKAEAVQQHERQLANETRVLKAETKRLQAEREEDARKLEKLRADMVAGRQAMHERHKEDMVRRLNSISDKQEQLAQYKRRMDQETAVVQRLAANIESQQAELAAAKDQFERHKEDKERDFRAREVEHKEEQRKLTSDLCEKFVALTLAQDREQAHVPVGNLLDGDDSRRGPNSPPVDPGPPNLINFGAGFRPKRVSCQPGCNSCPFHKRQQAQAHIGESGGEGTSNGPMPILEENLSALDGERME